MRAGIIALLCIMAIGSGVWSLESGVWSTAGQRDPDEYPFAKYDGTFTFVRVYFEAGGADGLRGYGRRGFGGEPPWHHDYPFAEGHLSKILNELTYVRARQVPHGGNVLEIGDPRLHQFPIAYLSEPGFWNPSDAEVAALRDYLMRGGFMIFDDFGNDGGRALYNLNYQLRRVFPELSLMPLDGSESVFDSFFHIDPRTLNLFYRGDPPDWWGIFEENDRSKRLLVVAANDMDLGEFWEFSDRGFFPVDMSNEAYKVGVNYIVYAMTH